MATTKKHCVFAGIDFDWEQIADNGITLLKNKTSVRLFMKCEAGTQYGETNLGWHTIEPRHLAAGASETLDLHAMTMPVFGDLNLVTISFADVSAIVVKLVTMTAGAELRVGAAASNAFVGPFGDASDYNKVGPGSALFLSNLLDGWDVPVSGRMLKIANPSLVEIEYKMGIIGSNVLLTSSSSSSGS